MSRYIDADKLVEEMQRCSYETWSKDVNRAWWAQAVKIKDNIVHCIERQPTADVVEVVRCKDCKWWKRMNGDKRLQCFHSHGLIRTTENDYCSRGERK